MLRIAIALSLLLVAAGPSPCAAGEPMPSRMNTGQDHYIRNYSEGSDYYWLRRDGTYKAVHHFDTGPSQTIDHGHWNAAGSRLVLHSDGLVPDLRLDDFTINVYNGCGHALLPKLRALVASRRNDPLVAHKPYDDYKVEGLRNGPVLCMASVSFERWPDAALLGKLLDTLDAWIAVPEPQRFAYEVWTYRGRTFLTDVPVVTQAHRWAPPLGSVKNQLDERPDSPPEYVLYQGTREEFVRADVCDFPRPGWTCLDSQVAQSGRRFIVP